MRSGFASCKIKNILVFNENQKYLFWRFKKTFYLHLSPPILYIFHIKPNDDVIDERNCGGDRGGDRGGDEQ